MKRGERYASEQGGRSVSLRGSVVGEGGNRPDRSWLIPDADANTAMKRTKYT